LQELNTNIASSELFDHFSPSSARLQKNLIPQNCDRFGEQTVGQD
jgi:hypothetical protein